MPNTTHAMVRVSHASSNRLAARLPAASRIVCVRDKGRQKAESPLTLGLLIADPFVKASNTNRFTFGRPPPKPNSAAAAAEILWMQQSQISTKSTDLPIVHLNGAAININNRKFHQKLGVQAGGGQDFQQNVQV